jgi:acyl-CoA thioester hydrolase
MAGPRRSPVASGPQPTHDWPFAVTHPVEVRFRDTDAMGHVNNACFATYAEVGRQIYWERLTGAKDFRRVPFILAHIQMDFRSPAYVGETLEVGIRIEWIGSRSFAFAYRISDRDTHRLVAEAFSVQAVYDYEEQRTFPFPPELRAQVERFEGRKIPDKP